MESEIKSPFRVNNSPTTHLVEFPPTPLVVNSICVSPNQKFISILCDNGLVRLVEIVPQSQRTQRIDEEPAVQGGLTFNNVKTFQFASISSVRAHAFSSSSNVLVICTENSAVIIELREFKTIQRLHLHFMPTWVDAISNGAESLRVAVSGASGVHIYAFPADVEGEKTVLHQHLYIAIAKFSASGRLLAVASLDGHIGVWTMDDLSLWFDYFGSERITSVSFSNCETRLAVGSWDGTISVYAIDMEHPGGNSGSWKLQQPLLRHSVRSRDSESFTLLQFAPNPRYICIFSGLSLRLHDTEFGGTVTTFSLFNESSIANSAILGMDTITVDRISYLATFSRKSELTLRRIPLVASGSAETQCKIDIGNGILAVDLEKYYYELSSPQLWNEKRKFDLEKVVAPFAHSIYPSEVAGEYLVSGTEFPEFLLSEKFIVIILRRKLMYTTLKASKWSNYVHTGLIVASCLISDSEVAIMSTPVSPDLSIFSINTDTVTTRTKIDACGMDSGKYYLSGYHVKNTDKLTLIIVGSQNLRCVVHFYTYMSTSGTLTVDRLIDIELPFNSRNYMPSLAPDRAHILWKSVESRGKQAKGKSWYMSLDTPTFEIHI